MVRKTASRPRPSRDRQFNLIFFVDAARTRTVRMKLLSVQLLLGFVAIVFVWAIASIFLIGALAEDRREIAAELRTTLGTLFAYQTRYDGVYELAYPDSAKGGGAAVAGRTPESPTSAPATTAVAPPAQTVAAVAAPTKARELEARPNKTTTPAPTVAATTPSPDSATTATTTSEEVWDDGNGSDGTTARKPDAQAKELPLKFGEVPALVAGINVVVENPALVASERNAEFLFDIRNTVATDKAEGFIWAVATFEGDNGKKTFVGVPRGIRVGGDGLALNPDRGHRFGIMRFRRKSFSFAFPQQFVGKLTSIRVHVKPRQGEGLHEYQAPVDLEIGRRGALKNAAPEAQTAGASKPG